MLPHLDIALARSLKHNPEGMPWWLHCCGRTACNRAKLHPLAAVRTLTPHPTPPFGLTPYQMLRSLDSFAEGIQKLRLPMAEDELQVGVMFSQTVCLQGGMNQEGEMKEGGELAAQYCDNRGGKSATAVPTAVLVSAYMLCGDPLCQMCTSSTRAGMLACSWP